ncbi:NlpC/P60 family protein [Rhodovulum visakhapatnamense]|uniref:NlpC/P60 family protein n=1 Tax=Rhodovulum visakhapatnamense TaxID=364297 RepID=A0A4R8GAD1_9RHOB|nr:NlpC/P60 family protein [Rhodovulum visakhapatnamense]TDX33376.1 NlpC/P60 family protein [Rhodovulum visakhapatnamense]
MTGTAPLDRRETPANDRVAATRLKGLVAAPRYADPVQFRVTRPLTDLLRAPGGPRERQLVLGEAFELLEMHEGFGFGWAARDGFVGYVAAQALAADVPAPTHRVAVPASHAYSAPDLKRPEVMGLSFGTELRVVSAEGRFFETAQGWFVPKPHLRPLNVPFRDPVTVAQLFFGVPYLWGGNSGWGIDCSGLVQMAWLASGRACPGDSDQQERELGEALPVGSPVERGDLLFWRGHVALAVDPEVMIHANGHTMSVAYERIADAVARIEAQGEGRPTAHRRG